MSAETDLLDRIDAATADLRVLFAGRVTPVEVAPTPPPPPAIAPPPAAGGLQDPPKFYASIRASDEVFGGTLTTGQFAGCEDDLKRGAGMLPLSWMAYCLATDYHESGHTMQPERERGSGDGPDADSWDDYLEKYDTGTLAAALGNTPEADGDGIKWAGRGKPQITGHDNYVKADAKLHVHGVLAAGESLVTTPDLALRPDVATAILVFGMLEGWFTGKTLNTYLRSPATLEQFISARRIVNGTDRAELIAKIAMAFQTALQAGGWQ